MHNANRFFLHAGKQEDAAGKLTGLPEFTRRCFAEKIVPSSPVGASRNIVGIFASPRLRTAKNFDENVSACKKLCGARYLFSFW